MDNQILQTLITRLKLEEKTEDEIANFLADITQAATVMLYKEALNNLSDNDMQRIEDTPDDETANKLIVDLYSQRVGTPTQELINVFLNEFAKNFLEEQK